jgi:CubicO group peptidase (beta-lactamase class C family)
VADRETGALVDADTRFRVGSITKTFTALALAQLRDRGKLPSLEEPVENILPELRSLRGASADAGPIRFRDVLLHHSGLIRTGSYEETYSQPVSRAQMVSSLALPAFTTPYDGYNYSNFGYGLLGLSVEALSGKSYRDYVKDEITVPLGLRSAAWALDDVPAAHRARSYNEKSGAIEPEWRLGALDASGGLFLSASDMARWASFHAEAFPPRDTADTGPVQRATLRELLSIGTSDPPNDVGHVIHQTPLSWDSLHACGERVFWKSGLVESFLSQTLFLPDHGVAIATTATTRMNLYAAQVEVLAALRATGALERREKQASPALLRAMERWLEGFENYDEERVKLEYTPEYFRFNEPTERATWMRKQRARVGRCERTAIERVRHAGSIRFGIQCARGSASITLTLESALDRIAWTDAQWRYRPTVEQRAQVEAQLALATTRRTAKKGEKPEEGDAQAELRKLGTCELGADRTTRSADETLYELRCTSRAQGARREPSAPNQDVRMLRTRFAEGDPTKVVGSELEPLPAAAAPCRPW